MVRGGERRGIREAVRRKNDGSETDGGTGRAGEFAPKFAELNDDVLFGEVRSREDKLSLRDRSLVTVVALMAQGLTDEIAEIVTHAAFYCGWPKAWAVFRMAKEIWNDEEE